MTIRRASILIGMALAVAAAGLALAPRASLAAAVGAQPSGLSMEVRAAFDGYFKYGEWLPLWVELENGGPDLEAEINVRLVSGMGTTVFSAAAPLPSGSRKRIPLYVLPNNYTHELTVNLVQGDEVLALEKVPVNPRPNRNYFIGLVSPERGALALLSSVTLPDQNRVKELLDLAVADLPERAEGLRSLDCLILNDIDTSTLTPEQKQALEAWVREGGRLVVGGGAGAQRTAAGLPAALLPLAPRNVAEVDSLSGLEPLAGDEAIRVPGPFVVATGDTVRGVTLAEQDGLVLVQESMVGSGAVDSISLDLSASPFDAWSGTAAFWEHLLSPGSSYPEWLPPDASLRQMRSGPMSYALSNLPSLDLPSVQSLAILLSIYILLVGPVNYMVLRWRKKLQWAWITIPLLTLAFSAGAFGLAYARRGTDLILNKIAVIQMLPEGTATVNTYVGLFSPAQQSYELEVAGGGLISPLNQDYNPWGPSGVGTTNEMVFVQGQPAAVRGLSVNQWSMQTFAAEGLSADMGHISSELRIDGGQIVGTVRNETPHLLTGVVAILGSQFVRLPDLAPGQQADLAIALAAPTGVSFGPPVVYRIFEQELNQAGPTGPSREVQLKQSVLESTLQPGGWALDPTATRLGAAGVSSTLKQVLLVGWIDQAPPEVLVAERKPAVKTTALVLAGLPYGLGGEGRLALPPGLLSGRLVRLPTEGGTCGQAGTAAVYIARGRAIFEFQLSDELRNVVVEELTVALNTDGGWLQPPSTAVYDWEKEAWTELQNAKMGSNVIAGAQSLVSPTGLVQVRLSTEGGGGGCYYVELGLSGARQ